MYTVMCYGINMIIVPRKKGPEEKTSSVEIIMWIIGAITVLAQLSIFFT